MAKALLRFETLDANQVNDIMAGRDPRPPADSSGSSPAVSNQPDSVGNAGASGMPNLNPGERPV
jgi:cell division protease FtsH